MNIDAVKQTIISNEAATTEACRTILRAIADAIIARTATNIRITEKKFWVVNTISELADCYNIAFFVNDIPEADITITDDDDLATLSAIELLFTKLSQSQAFFEEIVTQNGRYGIKWNRAGKKYMLLYSDSDYNFKDHITN